MSICLNMIVKDEAPVIDRCLTSVLPFIDRWVIDAGAVGGSSRGTWGVGALLRLIQVGNLQAYAFLFGLGVVALIYFAVMR